MDVPSVGKLIEGEAHRDAIHVAIAPVVAGEKLAPGQDVDFVPPGQTETVGVSSSPIGIVDPFLKKLILPGQRCYLFLYPQSITSLRHEWVHPAFAAEEKPVALSLVASVLWLHEFADELDMPYASLMEAAKAYLTSGIYTTQRGGESWRDCFSGREEAFWAHYEVATSTRVADHTASIFSCSC